MATFYIQLENKLLQISGDLTAENISKALGYVPVSPNVTNELSQRVDNITFDSLKDNPFLQDGSGELNIVDEAGNIIAKINADGIHSVDFIAGNHKLTDKIDSSALNGYAKESWVTAEITKAATEGKVDLTGYATEEWVENKNYLTEHQDISHLATKDEVSNIDFYNIKDNPIVNNGDGKLLFVDENGYIGLQLEEDGLYVKDVIADGHILSQKADKSDIPSLDGYATESYVNTELENYATKEDIKDIASNSTIIELSGKVSTLIGEDADKSVRTIANEELLAQLLEGNDNFQTLQELAAWIDEHPESAAAMNEAIQKNASDITNTLTSAKTYTDETIADIDFYSIKNNPIVNSEDGTLTFVDESGYIGLKVTEDGLVVKDVVTPEHTLSSKADKSELPTKVSDLTNDSGFITLADVPEVEIPSLDEYVKSEDLPNFDEFAKTSDIPSLDGYAKTEDIPSLDGYATEEWVENKQYITAAEVPVPTFDTLQGNPMVNDDTGEFNVVDDLGNIGFKITSEGIYAKDVISGDHVLSNKVDYVDGKQLSTEDFTTTLKEKVESINVKLTDTDDVLDDVDTNTYVKYVAQTLTEEQKAQVRENIGVGGTGGNVDLSEYATKTELNAKQDVITDLATIRSNAALGATALQTETYKGTVTGVKINGTTKSQSNGIVDLGTVITAHQTLKTINGESIVGSGNITIEGGSGNSNANVQAVDTNDVLDDVNVDYATSAYVDGLVGDINSVLDNIIDGEGSGGSSGGPTVEYVDYQGFITVEDNKVYVFTIPITELSINVETELPIGSVLRFRTEFEGCTLSVPDSVCWANGVLPNIESFKSYELSLTTTADRLILAVITTF